MRIEKIIANIIINDLMKHSNNKKCKVDELGLFPEDIALLAQMIYYEILDSTKVSKIIDHKIGNGGEIESIISLLDLWPKWDNKLEEMVNEIILNNSEIVEQIKNGKEKALGSLIGKLKQIDKSIDSKEAMKLLKEKIYGRDKDERTIEKMGAGT